MERLLNTYSLPQWLLFFYVYCFIGWLWECFYVSVRIHKLTNRGFMHGPLLPIYGSGAITMLFATLPVKDNPILVFVVACLSATVLEFVTGTVMESLFKVRYWDYTRYKYNYKGHICVKASLLWGFAGVALVFGVNRPIAAQILKIPVNVTELLAFGITVVAACDFGASFREAMDVREILIRLSEEKDKQLRRIEKRVDVYAAVYADGLEKGKNHMGEVMKEYADKLHEIGENSMEKLDGIKESGMEKLDELKENSKARADWTKAKLELLTETQKKKLNRYIIANPDAESKHIEISEMISVLKKNIFDIYKDDDNQVG